MEKNIDYAMILLKEMVLKLNNNLSKFINLAHKFKKNNPNSNVYDFFNKNDIYKNLSEHERRFIIKKVINVFEESVPLNQRTTVDEIQLMEETKLL